MRDLTNREKIEQFMRVLGGRARHDARVYFTGGSTAVLQGWRDTTIDIDVRFIPELDELFRALPELKEKLRVNIELASPPNFIPIVPGWEDRCLHIRREGKIDFYHYDPYSQALAKIERGHSHDMADVEMMLGDDLIEPVRLLALYRAIESELYRYPAIDPASFSEAVREVVERAPRSTA